MWTEIPDPLSPLPQPNHLERPLRSLTLKHTPSCTYLQYYLRGKRHFQRDKRLHISFAGSSQTKDAQRGLGATSVTPFALHQKQNKLLPTQLKQVQCCIYWGVSTARDTSIICTETVQVTLADAIVLRRRISWHTACPPRAGRGDRKERGGRGKKPSEI